MNDTNLLIIGDENAVFGFALLGVTGQVVHSAEEAHNALQHALNDKEIGIIFLTEAWATALQTEVAHHRATMPSPLLIEIPGSQPVPQHKSLRDLVQEALGIRLEG